MTLALRNATLVDGSGADPVRTSVTVDGDRITHIGVEPPRSDEAIDAEGLTLLPGLIEAHAHLGLVGTLEEDAVPAAVKAAKMFDNAKRLLQAGFTTARDCGGCDGGLVQAIATGLVTGPRVLPSGAILCQTGGHGDLTPAFDPCKATGVVGLAKTARICDGTDEVRRAARENFHVGATQIKVCVSGGVVSLADRLEDTQFQVDELQAAVAEARARATYVTAHAHTVGGIRNGLEAGIACFEHASFLDAETAAAIGRAGAAIVPTFAVARLIATDWQEWGLTPEIADRIQGVEEASEASVKLAKAAGVRIGSGSDMFGPVQRHWGLELVLKSAVLSPMEAIVSARKTNAEILRMSEEIGTVDVGKVADLIAIDGDPLDEPDLFDQPDRIVYVVSGGRVVKRP